VPLFNLTFAGRNIIISKLEEYNVIKRFTTRRHALAYLLIISFIGWLSISTFPAFAQGQNPDATPAKPGAAGKDIQKESPESTTAVIEKTDSAKPKVIKKHFPWLGVLLSLAIAGGLVYYFFILKTTLQINTTPAGARIYLDGKDSAKISPCQLQPAIGGHTIKAVLEGYADVEYKVVVKNGKNSLAINLDIATYEMTAPEANANVQRETTCLIRWDSSAMAAAVAASATGRTQGVTQVDLELFQDDIKVSDIALGVPNSGSYTWNVPAPTAEGHNFKILVSCSAAPLSRAFGNAFNLLGFKEDFTDNKADFWLPDNASDWRTAGGYYTASKTNARPAFSIYDFAYGESAYTVESRMRWSESSGGNSGAPLFIMLGNSNSFTNNFGYVLGYAMDGTVSIYKVENYNLGDSLPGSQAILYQGSSGAVMQGLNSWNTVKVVRNDAMYALFINDILVYTLIDSTYNPTHVMIGFGGAAGLTTCDFDYVYVTVNPGTH
jgi:hypothetical protein